MLNKILLLENFSDYNRFPKFHLIINRLHVNERFAIIIDNRKNSTLECDATDKTTLMNVEFYHRNVIMLTRKAVQGDNHIQNVHLGYLLSDIWLEIRFLLLLLWLNVKLNFQLYI